MAYKPVTPAETAAFLRQMEASRSNRYFGGMGASTAAHKVAGAQSKIGTSVRRHARKAARRSKVGAALGIAKVVASIITPWLGMAVGLGSKLNKIPGENKQLKSLREEKEKAEKELRGASGKMSATARHSTGKILESGEMGLQESARYAAKKGKEASQYGNIAKIASVAGDLYNLGEGLSELDSFASLTKPRESALDPFRTAHDKISSAAIGRPSRQLIYPGGGWRKYLTDKGPYK